MNASVSGTLMLNVDQTRLGSLLSPAASKLRSHAVESVRSRVVNLSELNPSISHEGVRTLDEFTTQSAGYPMRFGGQGAAAAFCERLFRCVVL